MARSGLSCWLPSLLGSNLSPMYTALGVQRPLLTSAQPLLCTQALNGTYKSRGRQELGDKREAGNRLQKGSEPQHTSLSQLCPPPAVATAKEERANKTESKAGYLVDSSVISCDAQDVSRDGRAHPNQIAEDLDSTQQRQQQASTEEGL